MQPSPSNFKQLTRTTHIAFGKLSLEIQVAVGLSRLGSNGNGDSIGKIQMIFGAGEGTAVLYTKWGIQAIHNLKDYKVKWPSKEEQKESSQVMQLEGFPNCVRFVDGKSLTLSQKPALDGNSLAAAAANNYHIEDFTIEVLNIIIHMLQGSYRRVGNLDPELKFLSRPGPPKSPVTTASRALKAGP
ncbi:hypothetical protein PPACK8108_LOCUS10520 [Phakopsora pachyrhizi]|uniref:Uncharacterized protein n=1 Tax=Phakopsora pachyrhizi TaxID=170000 RepID=A0AAV0B3H9_PHAPC|nr:hypothetical protein PPACK8108_LOCUS10520 [Phakopsora pachyrhizi]